MGFHDQWGLRKLFSILHLSSAHIYKIDALNYFHFIQHVVSITVINIFNVQILLKCCELYQRQYEQDTSVRLYLDGLRAGGLLYYIHMFQFQSRP